ncbi:MAG: hypothetical protein IJ058_03875 [Lachnospiraceae bacterium]|nr:hypothetical protein [Lachnospiraceae bacterium]
MSKENISQQEQEDIENALDAGKMIEPASSRRVLSQGEIDKIVDAYHELRQSEAKLRELMDMAEQLNASDDSRTDFTQRCAEYFPLLLKTLDALK